MVLPGCLFRKDLNSYKDDSIPQWSGLSEPLETQPIPLVLWYLYLII